MKLKFLILEIICSALIALQLNRGELNSFGIFDFLCLGLLLIMRVFPFMKGSHKVIKRISNKIANSVIAFLIMLALSTWTPQTFWGFFLLITSVYILALWMAIVFAINISLRDPSDNERI